MKVGILKETNNDNRVVLLPESVESLSQMNVSVIVEKGAGTCAFAADEKYEKAGAKVVGRDEIFRDADLILKINPVEKSEAIKFKKDQVFLAVLNPFLYPKNMEAYAKSGVTTFSLDIIPRTTRAQSMDVLSSQATIAGYKAVIDAAGNLPNFFPMFMTAAGTIKPAKVLILGAGVAGLQAIATARKLGAVVEVFDVRTAVKEEVQSLGGKFIDVEGAIDDTSAGGYAVEQTEDFKKRQADAIHQHVVISDVVICTAQIPGKKAPLLIKKDTVEAMHPGSLIIDLAASTGGNCELTKNEDSVLHKGVKIIGNSDYPSDMPSDASRMFGKNVLNFLKLIIDEKGNLNLNFEDDLVKGTCVTHNKQIVHEKVNELLSQ